MKIIKLVESKVVSKIKTKVVTAPQALLFAISTSALNMMKLEKIVILVLSIFICFLSITATAISKETASKEITLSAHKNPPTQQNKTSDTHTTNDDGPEVVAPESNLELKGQQNEDIGNVKEYFYVLTSLSLLVICLIVFRAMRYTKNIEKSVQILTTLFLG